MTEALAPVLTSAVTAETAIVWYALTAVFLFVAVACLGWSMFGNTGRHPFAFIVATTAGAGSSLLLVTCILVVSRLP